LRGSVTLEVIGDRTLWSDYRKHLCDLNPDIATYIGELKHADVDAKLRSADGLLLPSRYEPGGIVVGEALSFGVPVVVSDQIGSAEPISDDVCRRFPDGDIEAFEREVRRLVANARSERAALRQSAQAQSRQHFAPEKIARDLIEILQSTIRERASIHSGHAIADAKQLCSQPT
jgi:glycosyltransferase involved in cell wall biosynthesis